MNRSLFQALPVCISLLSCLSHVAFADNTNQVMLKFQANILNNTCDVSVSGGTGSGTSTTVSFGDVTVVPPPAGGFKIGGPVTGVSAKVVTFDFTNCANVTRVQMAFTPDHKMASDTNIAQMYTTSGNVKDSGYGLSLYNSSSGTPSSTPLPLDGTNQTILSSASGASFTAKLNAQMVYDQKSIPGGVSGNVEGNITTDITYS